MAKKRTAKARVDELLAEFEDQELTGPVATAYNHLVSYTEGLVQETWEGEALVGLCIEVLKARLTPTRP